MRIRSAAVWAVLVGLTMSGPTALAAPGLPAESMPQVGSPISWWQTGLAVGAVVAGLALVVISGHRRGGHH